MNLPKLNTINLNDNAFGINTQAPVVAFLAAHVPLQHLYLNNNGLGPHAGILVADALSELHAKKEAARKEGKERDAPQLAEVGAEHAEERRNEGDVCVIRGDGDDARPLDDRRRDMSA